MLPTAGPPVSCLVFNRVLPSQAWSALRGSLEETEWIPGQGGGAGPVHPWQALQPPWSLAEALAWAEKRVARPPIFGGYRERGYPETKQIIFDSRVYRNAVFLVGDVGSINYAAGTACLPRLPPRTPAILGHPTLRRPRRGSHGDGR